MGASPQEERAVDKGATEYRPVFGTIRIAVYTSAFGLKSVHTI